MGLDWYAYGFRYYDAQLGRFTGVDPIASDFAFVTPYNYAENRPIDCIDLWGLQAWEVKNEWNDDYIKAFGEYNAKTSELYFESNTLFPCDDLPLANLMEFAMMNELPFHFETLGMVKLPLHDKFRKYGLNLSFNGYKNKIFDASSEEYEQGDYEGFRNDVLNSSGAADIASLKNSHQILWSDAQPGDFIGLGRGISTASHIQSISKVYSYIDQDFLNIHLSGYQGNTGGIGVRGGNLVKSWNYSPFWNVYHSNGVYNSNYSTKEKPQLWRFNFMNWNKYIPKKNE